VIAVYSHKGGVGKTTVTMNLAKELLYDDVKKTNNILIIDTDTQLNLTYLIMGNNFVKEEVTNKNKTPDKLNEEFLIHFEKYMDNLSEINYNSNELLNTKYVDILSKLRQVKKSKNLNWDNINHITNIIKDTKKK